jgi:hypothetical protein
MQGPLLSGQAASLVESVDLPLPSGVFPPGNRPVVFVGAQPRHPGNAVLVEVRGEDCPGQFLRVVPEAVRGEAEWFRAVLPCVGAGRSMAYRVELVRGGQLLASLPSDGSWLTVTGDRAAAPVRVEQRAPETPYWAYELQYFGSVTVVFRQEIIGETPDGYHINFFIESGRVVGPRIEAVIRAEGADWLWIRRDGIAVIDVRATWETADGALISYRSGGVIELGPDGYTKVAAGQLAGNPPFCATAMLLTAHPRYQWVNRLQLLGFGRVDMERVGIHHDVYFAEVKDRPGHA